MRPLSHLFSSSIVGGLFYLYSRSFAAAFTCFLSGILIDLDHFIDFYLHYNRWCTGLRELCSNRTKLEVERIYILLHSIELVSFVWLWVIIFNPGLIWIAAMTGISVHILLDMLGNNALLFTYFFSYRLQKRFKKGLLFKDVN